MKMRFWDLETTRVCNSSATEGCKGIRWSQMFTQSLSDDEKFEMTEMTFSTLTLHLDDKVTQ